MATMAELKREWARACLARDDAPTFTEWMEERRQSEPIVTCKVCGYQTQGIVCLKCGEPTEGNQV
jgi:hypothetical protein